MTGSRIFFNEDPREDVIRLFYKELLGREPDEEGLTYYVNSGQGLDIVYVTIYTSEEAKKKRALEVKREQEKLLKKELPITLAIFAKDAEDSIVHTINSVKSIVSEIIVVDTGSTDNTVSVCKDLGARVYSVGFSDFGSIRTITGHLSREEWVLGLDADEILLEEDIPILKELISCDNIDIWGLPRKRWLDLGMTTQVEKEVYPDWQYRLFRNKTTIYYKRRVHEIIEGSGRRGESVEGPHIHHFQDVYKTGNKLKERNEHYQKLYDTDIAEGIEHKEPAVQKIDER